MKHCVSVCVFSLDRALTNLKSQRSALMASLKNPTVEVVRPQKAGEKKNLSTEHSSFIFPSYKIMKETFWAYLTFHYRFIVFAPPQLLSKVLQRIPKLQRLPAE